MLTHSVAIDEHQLISSKLADNSCNLCVVTLENGTRFAHCHFRAQKSLDFQVPPLPMDLEMDFPPSKSLRPVPYEQQVYINSYYRLEIMSVVLVFGPGFVNCCPSNLLSGSPPPPFPLRISILYTRIQCVRGGGYWVLGSDR
jgi:hypothetical protein